jgi:integrase/recombinase XerD
MLPHLEDFLLHIQANNYSEKTLKGYERDLHTFEDFLFDELQMDSFAALSKKDIDRYKAYLNSRDRKTPAGVTSKSFLNASSINRMLVSVRRYCTYLIDIDETPPVDPSAIKLIKTEKKHARVSEMDELIQLIESPTLFESNKFVQFRNRAMLEALFASGMRISELLNLQITQLDKTGKIFIRGKGRKERFIYLTKRAEAHIHAYLALRDDDSPFLFVALRGQNVQSKPISSNYLQMKIKEYREKLCINIPLSAHSLRHGFATYLAEQGANPAAIQILLGHESLDTTTKYVHASDRYAEDTHSKFHPLRK